MDQHVLGLRRGAQNAATGDAGESSATERRGSLAEILGQLHDTVTIAPATDLTHPIDEDWNSAR